jgi:CRISPR system Cascade subunit CasD
VLLRLEGPLQSWGTRSRFPDRDTENEPSKSGVIGLIGAALGMARDDEATLARLAEGRMAVRVDRQGTLLRDYHTAGGGTFRGKPHSVHGAKGTVLTQRHYLQDASFLVAIGYEDEALVTEVDDALGSPQWPLFLGRRACLPSLPIRVGVVHVDPEAALRGALWPSPIRPAKAVRLVIDASPGEGEPRQDQPLSFRLSARHFARRFVRTTSIAPGELTLLPEGTPLTSIVALRPEKGHLAL